jgi:hypothetical protein
LELATVIASVAHIGFGYTKDLKGSVQWGKKLPFLLVFGKFMKNGVFFVFTVNSESLTALR